MLLHDKKLYSLSGFKEGFHDFFDSLDLSKAGQNEEIQHDFYMDPVKAELVLYGVVQDQTSGQTLEAEVTFRSKGLSPGRFTTDGEGYYNTKLPGEGLYYLSAKVEGYKPLRDSIEIATEEYYEEFEKDLYLIPQIKITGYVLNDKNNEPLSAPVVFATPGGKNLKVQSQADDMYARVVKAFFPEASTE